MLAILVVYLHFQFDYFDSYQLYHHFLDQLHWCRFVLDRYHFDLVIQHFLLLDYFNIRPDLNLTCNPFINWYLPILKEYWILKLELNLNFCGIQEHQKISLGFKIYCVIAFDQISRHFINFQNKLLFCCKLTSVSLNLCMYR